MGGLFSSVKHDTKANIGSVMTRGKLADLKATKMQRDMQLSMRMASIRDQMHFMLAFYGSMVAVNLLRAYKF
jgi:hypothetical protein